jgi:hypothetical protein
MSNDRTTRGFYSKYFATTYFFFEIRSTFLSCCTTIKNNISFGQPNNLAGIARKFFVCVIFFGMDGTVERRVEYSLAVGEMSFFGGIPRSAII